ncbi:MAG TPA: hypothetical protein VNF47_05500 [Streptosporangiaceae bacterium]|nr:hypothetical protein [Streptosporangiaceae bacterium]
MLRTARELLAVRSPLDAELMVSELLGTWWSQQPGLAGRPQTRRRRGDVEELVGEGLVDYAAGQGSPAALALLSGIACLGTTRQAVKAEQAALDLMERGVARPAWAERAGAVVPADCYIKSDAYYDHDEVICVFSYAGEEEHALVTVIDYNAGGLLKDGWVTSQVTKLLEHCRDLVEADAGPAKAAFRRVPAPDVRRLLESALEVTETIANPPVTTTFPSYHAFIRARIRTLPPSQTNPAGHRGSATSGWAPSGPSPSGSALSGWVPSGSAHPMPALQGSAYGGSLQASRQHSDGANPAVAIGPGASRRPVWRQDRRAMLVVEFLASDEAEDLSDLEAASRCADYIIDYGCDQDFGRPLRVSPAKLETFLLDWLPRKIMLTSSEQHAMPHVLVAWSRWAGAKSGLGMAAIGSTVESVFDSMPTFSRVYRDPASFGLEPGLVARLLPDRDLEALPRRVFAFGVLEGTYRGTNLSSLDPASPEHRRILLAADHDGLPGQAPSAEHLDQHVALAERLWHGDPPELWEAAQRLLDLGLPRHAVVHALIDAIQAAGHDDNAIRLILHELPPEPD